MRRFEITTNNGREGINLVIGEKKYRKNENYTDAKDKQTPIVLFSL